MLQFCSIEFNDMEQTHSSISKKITAASLLVALGIIYGDIGTSPLYAFREALHHSAPSGGIQEAAIFGVLSLALWSLILVVTIKYIIFLMRADNEGEGGVLALLALAGRGVGGRRGVVLALGAVGAALFYGDAIITPALSVLSAVEGSKTIPGIGESISQQTIIYITLAIMVCLFAIQYRGTALVSQLFGPICVIWFLVMGGLGLLHHGAQRRVGREVATTFTCRHFQLSGDLGEEFSACLVGRALHGAGLRHERHVGLHRLDRHGARLHRVLVGRAGDLRDAPVHHVDLAELAEECPRGCNHRADDCAIVSAVARGELGETGIARLDSIHRLFDSMETV